MSVFSKISVSGYFFAVLLIFTAAGRLREYAVIFAAAFLHEGAHIAVMKILKIKCQNIKIMPYGLIIKSEMTKNPNEEIFVSAMGPAANFFAFLICVNFKNLTFFALCNLALFLLNLAPALPLDGAVIIKAFLAYAKGYLISYKIMLTVTKITAVITVIFGMIFLIITKYNISLLIIGMFLLYNIKNEKENLILLRKKLLCRDFLNGAKRFKIKHIGVAKDVCALTLLSSYTPQCALVVSVFDENFKIIGTLSQAEISDGILKYGARVKTGMLLREDITNEKQAEKNTSVGGKADAIYRDGI